MLLLGRNDVDFTANAARDIVAFELKSRAQRKETIFLSFQPVDLEASGEGIASLRGRSE